MASKTRVEVEWRDVFCIKPIKLMFQLNYTDTYSVLPSVIVLIEISTMKYIL